jgi:probable rRNA maturation factor
MEGESPIEIIVASSLWGDEEANETRFDALIERVATAVLADAGAAGLVAIQLTDDAGIRSLNKQFLGKDKPTNVLSFPAAPMPGYHMPGSNLPSSDMLLGDIAIAYETVTREAQDEDKHFEDHLSHLVVHGLLHLLGEDHATTADAERMESREIAILATLGIADPYRNTDPVS